ncbi:MAG: hypothetical protein AAF479_09790 [Pseudomonadota bacterium]
MLKWIARAFGLISIGVLASDVMGWISAGSFRLTALGEWWFWAHKDSLQVLQPAIERHVESWLPFSIWDPGVQTLLEWPFVIETAVLTAAFWLLSLRRG